MELHSIAISPRLTGKVGEWKLLAEAAANQAFNEDRQLLLDLQLVGGMLIVTPAAAAEVWTRRLYAAGRRRFHGFQRGSAHPVAQSPGSHGYALSRQYVGNEQHFAFRTRQAVSAVDQLFNRDLS